MNTQAQTSLSDLDIARAAVEAATDHQGEDVVLLDIAQISGFADYFVICNGTSVRQIRAIVEAIDEKLSSLDQDPHQVEGTPESGWVLMDYGSVVVHVFTREVREFYRLERLWSEATTILRLQ
jgi:ribosome-associated protein